MTILTVIIPTYNASKTIERTLVSLFTQSEIPNVIVVDDCSTDNTLYLVKEKFSSQLDKGILKILSLKQNCGPSVARQVGIENVITPYLTFMDADDYYFGSDVLKKMDHALEGFKPDLLMFKYITKHKNVFVKKKYKTPKNPLSSRDAMILKINHPHPIWHYIWNKCYRTAIIKSHLISFDYNIKSAEDVKFNCDYLPYADKVYFINEYLYLYDCTGTNSLTRSTSNIKNNINLVDEFNNERNNYQSLIHTIKSIGCYEECIDSLRKNICFFMYKLKCENQKKPDLQVILNKYKELPDYKEIHKHLFIVAINYRTSKILKIIRNKIKRILVK